MLKNAFGLFLIGIGAWFLSKGMRHVDDPVFILQVQSLVAQRLGLEPELEEEE